MQLKRIDKGEYIMKNKKLIAIIITVALTFTACQSSKANIGASTEVSGDSTSVTETTVSTSSVETSEVSTEESKDVTLSNEDKRRIELFERASTVKRDDSEGAILKKMGDGYIVTGSGISRYLYEICPWEYFEVGNGLGDYLAYYNYKSEEVELNGNISRFPKEISDKLNQLNSESTLENVVELFGDPFEVDNMTYWKFTNEDGNEENGIIYFGDNKVSLFFGYTNELKVYIINSIKYVDRIGNHDYMEEE